ncbi:hypothetical protein [Deinococcus rubellus]|uniref:HAD family phosphatase n=1 Tax=Deinococcus rubellus TaxID=1889240 RepID=A0ABY5YED3_9DEIO|nr:hypothetical protein [Deinococcus rubellus]UWX63205.1 hypothetical protein N0D28_10620 [Deinococcus rubellus]
MATSRLRAVILDLDGILIDGSDVHTRAWVTSFRQRGFDVFFGQVRPPHRHGR